MILYHGSITRVEVPIIMTHASYRPLDFGTGFYTTMSYRLADQYLFHTSAALTFLKASTTVEVAR